MKGSEVIVNKRELTDMMVACGGKRIIYFDKEKNRFVENIIVDGPVRCRDCTLYDGEGYGCSYHGMDDPNGYCSWGESKWNMKCMKDNVPCLHTTCCEAQGVRCCGECKFRETCTTACFKVKRKEVER